MVDLRDLWALTETLKLALPTPTAVAAAAATTAAELKASAEAAAEAAAAPVLARMNELLSAMDKRATELVTPLPLTEVAEKLLVVAGAAPGSVEALTGDTEAALPATTPQSEPQSEAGADTGVGAEAVALAQAQVVADVVEPEPEPEPEPPQAEVSVPHDACSLGVRNGGNRPLGWWAAPRLCTKVLSVSHLCWQEDGDVEAAELQKEIAMLRAKVGIPPHLTPHCVLPHARRRMAHTRAFLQPPCLDVAAVDGFSPPGIQL